MDDTNPSTSIPPDSNPELAEDHPDSKGEDDPEHQGDSNPYRRKLIPVYPIKLLINKGTNKVLFAEAYDHSIRALAKLLDTPFHILSFVLCLEEQCSLYKLEKGLGALGMPFEVPRRPRVAPPPEGYYTCGPCTDLAYVTEHLGVACPDCGKGMSAPVRDEDEEHRVREGEDGDNEEETGRTYLILDDLTIKPCESTATTLSLLNSLNVKDPSVLEERIEFLTPYSVATMLRASLSSVTVLSDAFLGSKEENEPKRGEKRPLDETSEPIKQSPRRSK